MKRNAKAQHATEMLVAAATGYALEEFASPRLRSAARADRGHCKMTAEEYREHRMHRGQISEHHLELIIDRNRNLKASLRLQGGRPVHGYRRGYRPGSYDVQRCTHRAV